MLSDVADAAWFSGPLARRVAPDDDAPTEPKEAGDLTAALALAMVWDCPDLGEPNAMVPPFVAASVFPGTAAASRRLAGDAGALPWMAARDRDGTRCMPSNENAFRLFGDRRGLVGEIALSTGSECRCEAGTGALLAVPPVWAGRQAFRFGLRTPTDSIERTLGALVSVDGDMSGGLFAWSSCASSRARAVIG